MATSKSYTVKFRRKRLRKTDYKARLRLLVSKKNRLVIRKTLNQIYLQIINYDKNGDKVLFTLNSKILKKYGWGYGLNNLSASYLTGLLFGLGAKKKKITNLILDIGLSSSIKGSVYYAALKGVLDSGIEVPHDKKILPNEDRVKGKHIVDYALLLKKQPELYKKQFSSHLKNNVSLENLTKTFDAIKEKILAEYKNA